MIDRRLFRKPLGIATPPACLAKPLNSATPASAIEESCCHCGHHLAAAFAE
jgi:hypothetical protein